jgi:GIY-YIG catalytic domain
MGYIYCLYSTADGIPRYVGQTRNVPARRRKQHLAASLDKSKTGRVNDWIRDVLRTGNMVEVYTIQEDVAPIDLDMFETYWIGQFPGLINSNASTTQPSQQAEKITAAIQALVNAPPSQPRAAPETRA